MTTTILVAGATGDLGARIARALLRHDVELRVLTRPGNRRADELYADDARATVVSADYRDAQALTAAMSGVETVVSAVSGTRPVVMDAQSALLQAAVRAGVSRFIPSDYSDDYRRITPGTNRNFELRREFAAVLDAAPIRASSVLSGAFTEILVKEAPMILFGQRRVLYWSSADRILDFTTKDDVAHITAQVALDTAAPRFLEVVGDRITAREVAETLTRLTGSRFRLQWAGTAGTLSAMSRIGRRLSRESAEPFPAWQGMQYFVSMFSGESRILHADNDRYGHHEWTTVRDVLAAHLKLQ